MTKMKKNMSKILYVFLEGPTDEVFFKNILEKCLKSKNYYTKCKYVKIAKDNFNKVQRKIMAIPKEHSFIILLDNDFGNNPKISKYSSVYPKKTEIVKNMIEGWLLAGFDNVFTRREVFRHFYDDTEKVNHHKFANSSPIRFENNEDNFFEFLAITNKFNYDYNEAKRRNNSFKRFFNKLELSC